MQRLAVLNYLPTLSNSINTTQIWLRNGAHIPSSSASQKKLNKWNSQTDKMSIAREERNACVSWGLDLGLRGLR